MTTTGPAYGRYEIRGELGWGGFAMVYRAWDSGLRREVALKALLPHLARDPDLRRRFLAEAQALARLQHSNIVPVYDIGEAEDRPFFTMALVDGQTLFEILASSKTLPLEQVIDIVRSLAAALDELHSRGLVHRDLKPQNVMLDRSGRVVLMDLGIARALDGTGLTQTGATLGTPPYMAPEQVRGERVTPATDIYALGVFTYHLLAGRPPFMGDTPSILHAQVYEPPPALRNLRPGLPEPVHVAIDTALAKEPARRPPSAGQFVKLLNEPRPDPTARLPQAAPPVPDRVGTVDPTKPLPKGHLLHRAIRFPRLGGPSRSGPRSRSARVSDRRLALPLAATGSLLLSLSSAFSSWSRSLRYL